MIQEYRAFSVPRASESAARGNQEFRPAPRALTAAETGITRWAAQLEHWIGNYPAVCLTAALVVGVGAGWLIKRK